MMYWGSGKKRICGCCIRIRAGISVRIRVRDGVMISNRVRRRVKLVNYSLITALPIATSGDPHIRLSAFHPWPLFSALQMNGRGIGRIMVYLVYFRSSSRSRKAPEIAVKLLLLTGHMKNAEHSHFNG